jgi:hypothetical protein
MKRVIWTDDKGWKHASIVKDDAKPKDYPMGLPSDPPDINQINWENVKRDLHNLFIDRGLYSWSDIQKPSAGFENAIRGILLKELILLFKLLEV